MLTKNQEKEQKQLVFIFMKCQTPNPLKQP